MKIAVLSDIHGNLPPMEVVVDHIQRWNPDAVIINGDTINIGPKPAECWALAQRLRADHHWHINMGNHEAYILEHADGTQDMFFPMANWTLQKIRPQLDTLRGLPKRWQWTSPSEETVIVTHASMRGLHDKLYPFSRPDDIRRSISPAPAVICVSHTHYPFIKQFEGTLIVNSGTVGLPAWDGLQTCYAQISYADDRWSAELVRLNYDREQTERDFFESGVLAETDLFTQLFYYQWKTARPLIFDWIQSYAPLLNEGVEIDVLVRRMLEKHHLPIVGRAD